MDDTVKRTIQIPRDDLEKFRERHPGYGDLTWFVREAIRKYNELQESTTDEILDQVVKEIKIPRN